MIRSICAATAGLFLFAGAVTAQPASDPLTSVAQGWQATGHASTTSFRTGSVQASDQLPAGSFAELEPWVTGGDTVFVVDASGRETRGRVATLSAAALTLAVDGAPREFGVDVIQRIERRRRDPVRNGLLVGAGAGALLGFGLGRSADSPACPRSGLECGQGALIGTVGGALWGAVGGWIADALIRRREVVYRAQGPG